MAVMVLRTCQQVEGGLPADVKSKMMFNIVVDFAVGLVPFIGDLADALFRANTKNAVLLEKHLRQKGLKALKAQGRTSPMEDPTDPAAYDQILTEENGPPPAYSNNQAPRTGTQVPSSGRTQDRVPEQSGGGGWFNKKRQPDIERGSDSQGKGSSSAPPVRSK